MSNEATEEERLVVNAAGMLVSWDLEGGFLYWNDQPVVAMWINSSLLGLMTAFQKMVGAERFNLALQGGGRDGAADDWNFISTFPTFEEGFHAVGVAAGGAGWGRWELVSIDREEKVARFR